MRAIEEIGIGKAARFALGEIQKALLKLAWLPPVRKWLLQVFGSRIGKETVVLNVDFINIHRTGFQGLRIGNHCFIGEGCMLDLASQIELKNHVTLSQRVVVNTHTNVGYKNHALQPRFPAFEKPVHIEENCFVGVGSILLAGTRIGKHSFVGAASLVKGSVPPHSVIAGNPARPLQLKNQENSKEKKS